MDGYTNLPSGGNTNSIRGFSIFGDKNSHQYRIQHSLWNSLRIYQSFAYLPLLAPPGEFVPDSEDKPPSSGPASVERLDLEEIELSTSSSTVESPPPSLKPSGDVYTVHSGNTLSFHCKPIFLLSIVIPEESVSLRYLVRFCIQEASGKHLWNTQVVLLYTPPYLTLLRKSPFTIQECQHFLLMSILFAQTPTPETPILNSIHNINSMRSRSQSESFDWINNVTL